MRTALIFLLAANIVALVLFQFSGGRSANVESAVGHEPYQAEKVKVIAAAEPVAPAPLEAEKKPVSAVETPPQPVTPAKPVPPTVPPVKQVSATQQCMEWSNIADADLERARKALQSLKLTDKVFLRKMEKTTGYWVYIPQRKTLADAQKKVSELKALGVEDTFILQENTAWRYAISLGVFSTEEAAAKYLAQLREKGVRTAVSGPRNRAAEGSIAVFRSLDVAAAAELTTALKDFAGSEIRSVDCR